MTADFSPTDDRPDREEPEERTGTVPTSHGPGDAEADADVVSDPALDDRLGSEWVDEGGATPAGPATQTPGPDDPEQGDPDLAETDLAEDNRRGADGFGEAGLPRITLDPPD